MNTLSLLINKTKENENTAKKGEKKFKKKKKKRTEIRALCFLACVALDLLGRVDLDKNLFHISWFCPITLILHYILQ